MVELFVGLSVIRADTARLSEIKELGEGDTNGTEESA